MRIEGTRSNRNGIGAVVTLATDAGTARSATVKTGSSYLSQSELTVTFGLGASQQPKELLVKWPSGTVDKVTAPQPGRVLVIKEGQGSVSAKTTAAPRPRPARASTAG